MKGRDSFDRRVGRFFFLLFSDDDEDEYDDKNDDGHKSARKGVRQLITSRRIWKSWRADGAGKEEAAREKESKLRTAKTVEADDFRSIFGQWPSLYWDR